MAQRVTVEMVDDLDGTTSDSVSTVAFSVDGVNYEIDLNEVNAERLRDNLAEFVTRAHRLGGRATRGTARGTARRPVAATQTREQNHAVRDWARTNGWPMSDRGRIPADVVAAYQQAQTGSVAETTSEPSGSAKASSRRKEPAFSG